MAIKRRAFLRDLGVAAGAAAFLGREALAADAVWPYAPYKAAKVVVCQGTDYITLLGQAFGKLGGLQSFIPKGASVLVKPNIGWDRTPEYAANTNPHVVAAVVQLTLAAGAGEVKVYDLPCDDRRRTYDQSGIADAARDAGAEVSYVDDAFARTLAIADGAVVSKAEVYADVLAADVVVNVPVAKHHSLAGLTLGMKNLMGVLLEDRGKWHQRLNAKLVDLAFTLKPALTVIDATRVMTAGGPSGGDLAYVKRLDKLIVTSDITAADAYAATLFGWEPTDLGVVNEAKKRGLGTADVANMDIVTVGA